MASQLNDNSFPITFDVEAQGVHEVFDDKNAIVNFLDREADFWTEVGRTARTTLAPEMVDVLIEAAGRAAINGAYTKVRATDDPQTLADSLSELARSVALFGSGSDGEIVLQDIGEGHDQGFALALAAAGTSHQALRTDMLQGRRIGLSELLLLAGGSSKLATLRGLPKNRKAEIGRIISSARDRLKESEAKQREIDAWFEAHREQLDRDIEAARKKSVQLQEDYLKGFEVALDRSQQMDEARHQQFVKDFDELLDRRTAELRELHDGTQSRLQTLENVYTSKLVLDGPSQLWRTVRHRALSTALGALVLFVLLLAGPTWLASANWEAISVFLKDLIASSTNGFSLTAIAALTIPTLGYGWLLRHVSRVFVHNLNLVSDAEYREVLARTFLGLAEQKSAGVTEAERVLVLNALFRPAPPHAPDDGPPTGLLDLLGKRP